MIRALTKNGTTIDLTAAPYYSADGNGIDLGGVAREWEAFGGPHLSAPRFGPTDSTAPRLLPFTIEVTGTTADNLAANRDALLAVLPDDTTPTTVTLGATGGTYSATATARRVDGLVSSPYTMREDVGLVATVAFTLACDPYLTTAAETLYSAASANLPAVFDMSAQTGDAPSPWDLLVDFETRECVAFYAGRYPDESAVIGDFAFPLAAATWTDTSGTGAAAADAAGYPDGVGNTLWGTEGVCYTDVDVTDLEPGEYLLVVKAKSADGSDPGTVSHPYADPVTITGTSLGLYPLGVVTLPTSAVRGAATSTLRLTLTGAGTGDSVYVNALFLIPASFDGLAGWRRTSGHAHTLRWEDEMVYADDVSALSEAFGGRQLTGLGGALVMVGEEATPTPMPHAHVTVTT